jgi:hypothetical protein
MKVFPIVSTVYDDDTIGKTFMGLKEIDLE